MITKEISSKSFKRFYAQLHKNGLKITRQRVAVHQAMTELVHASAEKVCDYIRENSLGNANASSIYNILLQLSELGIYQKRLSSDSKMYFDIHTEPHLHVYDCENNSYRDIFDEKLYENVSKVIGTRRFRGYTIENLDIEFIVRPKKKKPVGLAKKKDKKL